jgi:hypothetical protein
MQPQRVSVDLTQSPPVYIPPGLKGEITSLNQNDVLCGRGSAISNYSGNIQLRALAAAKREVYETLNENREGIYMRSDRCRYTLAEPIRALPGEGGK